MEKLSLTGDTMTCPKYHRQTWSKSVGAEAGLNKLLDHLNTYVPKINKKNFFLKERGQALVIGNFITQRRGGSCITGTANT